MKIFPFGLVAGLTSIVIAGAIAAQAPSATPQTAAAWRTFEGTWSATGQRQVLPTAGQPPPMTLQLSGAVAITAGEGLSRGFRGEMIGFDDGSGLSLGRAVWTDDRGDRVFSQLKADALRGGRQITGTIISGTGRYAGMTGEYTFEWQYLITADDGTIQGRSIGLRGRVRAGGSAQ